MAIPGGLQHEDSFAGDRCFEDRVSEDSFSGDNFSEDNFFSDGEGSWDTVPENNNVPNRFCPAFSWFWDSKKKQDFKLCSFDRGFIGAYQIEVNRYRSKVIAIKHF